jgi:hypothetical protein
MIQPEDLPSFLDILKLWESCHLEIYGDEVFRYQRASAVDSAVEKLFRERLYHGLFNQGRFGGEV